MTRPRLSATLLVIGFAVSLASPAAYADSRASRHADASFNRPLLAQNKSSKNGKSKNNSYQRDRSANDSRNGGSGGEFISRDKAASIAWDATGGRVLQVKLSGSTYRVKVLLDGERVRTVSVDARTGQVR